jgi:hypothetical protein
MARFRRLLSLVFGVAAVACGGGGTPCSSAADCKRNETCDTEANECIPLQREGGVCFAHADCVEPLRCSFGVCESGNEGSACFVDDHCEVTLHCNWALDPAGCAPGGPGQTCGVDDHCDEPLICKYATAPPTCSEKSQLGEPCGIDSDCADNGAGVVCVYAYNPALCREPGNAGDPCATSSDCMAGLVCAGEVIGMLTCTPQP